MNLDFSKYLKQPSPAAPVRAREPDVAANSKPVNLNLNLSLLNNTAPVPAPIKDTINKELNNLNAGKFAINIPRQITAWNADGTSKDITLNDKQYEFAQYVANGFSCVLIGAAGTGKTTCTQAGIAALMQTGNVMHITDASHKHLRSGAPGIVITSYTRRAVQNIKRQMPLDLAANTITVHKTLEYSPVIYEVQDEETGKMRNKRVFEPKRGPLNKLCSNIKTVVIDEASMLSVDLFNDLQAALPSDCQYIFIGDLNQLPPVFGHAILGYKLLDLPVIELTEVYRQALESPIIRLAHRILSGNPIMHFDIPKFCEPGKLQILPYPKQLDSEHAMLETVKMFYAGYDSGAYNPETDIILCPQTNDKSDKKYNCTLINKYIANYIARKEGRITYEIIAGFNKLYYSVGDTVIYDKQDAKIVKIEPNPNYLGISYQVESADLDYFGHNSVAHMEANNDIDPDKLFELASEGEDEGLKRASSHIVTVELYDSHSEETSKIALSAVGDMLKLDLAYAMTVHKSQGSEWKKVFLLLHKSHNVMLSRELLYTAVTRARECLIIVCEKDSLLKGITKQKIRGNTLAEKALFFKGKIPSSEQTKPASMDEFNIVI